MRPLDGLFRGGELEALPGEIMLPSFRASHPYDHVFVMGNAGCGLDAMSYTNGDGS